MAITNYTELQSAISDWRHRTDLSAQAATFIALAEARIFRELDARGQETETELNTVSGSRFVALPSDFVRPIALFLKANSPREPLGQRLPQDFAPPSSASIPSYWAIDGANIAFDVECDQVYPFDFRYVASLALSGSNTTNYILTKYPGVYLFGSLAEAATFDVDQQSFAAFDARFRSALEAAKEAEHRNKSAVPLRTEFYAPTFDIFRGY